MPNCAHFLFYLIFWASKMFKAPLEDFHEAFLKLLERYNKCIAAGGDYFEGGLSFMCLLSIKMPIQKTLEIYLMVLVFLYQ